MSETPASDSAESAEPTIEEIAEQKQVRLDKRARMLAAGLDPYAIGLEITDSIPAVRARHGELDPDIATGEHVALAGRVVLSRNTGKLCFATLQSGDGERLQVMLSLAVVGEESLDRWKEFVDLGDHVHVTGEVITSRRGELSIMVSTWAIAAKAILPLPTLHKDLNEETRVRQRYLDLIVREQARRTVRARAAAVASLRATFAEHGYLEVETPMLQTMHGGASARPFITHSNA